MDDLRGKVAVITGAASGIGRALAERLAAEGMKLVLADVEENALSAAAEAIAKTGAAVVALRTDVSLSEEVEALADSAVQAFGAVHLLCNNAGVAASGFTWECSLAEWEWVLGVNLWGVIHGVRAFVPGMLAQQGECHIVNTASVAGLVSTPGMAPYNVTKHGVVTLSETLQHELQMVTGGRINVSVLCPGWVATRIAESHRNRPEAVEEATKDRPVSAGVAKMQHAVQQLVASGISPAQVADDVVKAVREKRFYVLTHPEMTPDVRRRLEAILDGKSPAASLPR